MLEPSNTLTGVVVRLRVKPGKEDAHDALVAELTARAKDTEPGTLAYVFFHDRADPSELVVIEIYRDAAAQAAHKDGPTIKAMLPRIADCVDLAATKRTFIVDPIAGFIRG